MTKDTKTQILEKTSILYAQPQHSDFSMRSIAKTVGISPSVLYHHFENKDVLLWEMYRFCNKALGQARSSSEFDSSILEVLKERIRFQFKHAAKIVAVLKFYMEYRNHFDKNEEGFLPPKSTLHIQEILQYGIDQGIFANQDLEKQSRVITHAINGYILEYFPHTPKGDELEKIVEELSEFIYRGIKKKGGEKK